MTPSPYIYPGMLDVAMKAPTQRITVEELFERVCRKFSVTEKELKSRTRKKAITEARHFMMYYLVVELGMGLTEAGRIFGRDHTSVMYARDRIAGYLKIYPGYIELIWEIRYDYQHVVLFKERPKAEDIPDTPREHIQRAKGIYNNIQSNYLP